jgi:hypothetical protein
MDSKSARKGAFLFPRFKNQSTSPTNSQHRGNIGVSPGCIAIEVMFSGAAGDQNRHFCHTPGKRNPKIAVRIRTTLISLYL